MGQHEVFFTKVSSYLKIRNNLQRRFDKISHHSFRKTKSDKQLLRGHAIIFHLNFLVTSKTINGGEQETHHSSSISQRHPFEQWKSCQYLPEWRRQLWNGFTSELREERDLADSFWKFDVGKDRSRGLKTIGRVERRVCEWCKDIIFLCTKKKDRS